jgi:thymidine phosphorylase
VSAPFLPQEVIRAKRDGNELPAAAIERFVLGLTDGSIGDDQVAAFAMAVYFRGMSIAERVALTSAMAHSGATMHWDRAELPGPVLDKHSTGGVGDKVSLMLAPLVAACGGVVPMISGRGLGHTGGTLDKLESIPGYDATPSQPVFRSAVLAAGCAVIGQTENLAPADRRLYSIRDVTATVESIDLITASILSKKLAADLDALVMDVKFGSGAFMSAVDGADELARSIVDVATGAGLRTTAFLTDMNEALGRSAGNALEVAETIGWLAGTFSDTRLDEVVYTLGAEMLVLGGLAPDTATALTNLRVARESGRAAERFGRMVAALGGPNDLMEHPGRYLPKAAVAVPVYPSVSGPVSAIDVRAVGMSVVALGGGRARASDPVDPAVGLSDLAGLGETVGPDRPLAIVHARSASEGALAADALRSAFNIDESGRSGATRGPVVLRRIAHD